MKPQTQPHAALTNKTYLTTLPRDPLPDGTRLVHNHVVPRKTLGLWGFRAWTQTGDDPPLELCTCAWAGADLHGMPHYRVSR